MWLEGYRKLKGKLCPTLNSKLLSLTLETKFQVSLDYTCKLRLTYHSLGINLNDLFSEGIFRLRSQKLCMYTVSYIDVMGEQL